MNWLVDIFAAPGLGAITGLVGGWLAKREARKMQEDQYRHDERMADIELQIAAEERKQVLALGEQNRALAEQEGKFTIEGKEIDALTESIKQQGKKSGHEFFDGLLRWVRPAITGVLLWMLFDLQSKLEQVSGGVSALPKEQQAAMFLSIVDAIIFLATTAVGWWFASRRGQIK